MWLTACEETIEILPGKETGMLVYRAEQDGMAVLDRSDFRSLLPGLAPDQPDQERE
jgi:hypothetical protein